jgi:hypothetical protein
MERSLTEFAAVMLRIYIPLSQIAGLDYAEAYPAIAWLCWVPNLLVAQLLVRSARGRADFLSVQPAIADVQFLLNEWFDDLGEDEPVISREVGIVLASADFSQEVTTTSCGSTSSTAPTFAASGYRRTVMRAACFSMSSRSSPYLRRLS